MRFIFLFAGAAQMMLACSTGQRYSGQETTSRENSGSKTDTIAQKKDTTGYQRQLQRSVEEKLLPKYKAKD